MFVKVSRSGYTRHFEQFAHGDYLAIFCASDHKLFACVRYVKMSQCGHFMMGTLRIGQAILSVSGPLGNDGLPMDLHGEISYGKNGEQNPCEITGLIAVPDDIAKAYWANDGHNTVEGPCVPMLRDWARENMKALKKAGRARIVATPEIECSTFSDFIGTESCKIYFDREKDGIVKIHQITDGERFESYLTI